MSYISKDYKNTDVDYNALKNIKRDENSEFQGLFLFIWNYSELISSDWTAFLLTLIGYHLTSLIIVYS